MKNRHRIHTLLAFTLQHIKFFIIKMLIILCLNGGLSVLGFEPLDFQSRVV